MSEHPRAGEIFLQRYEIIERLGSGGVGTVFKARQVDAGRIIALKFLHKELAEDPATKARFIREAKALHELQHDNIVSVYHLGETDSGVPYLAMEYIQGRSLRELIREGPLPIARAVAIAVQVCAALSYMHSRGVIHRDIKPDNIVLVQDSDSDYVKIIDFGMVRFESQREQKLTSTGTVVGTAEYMSPEACRGLSTDARSDIYSLTVCLYEMILGVLPYSAGAPVELMYKHVHAPVPQLENSGANRLINEILRRGMAKNPEERYQIAEELRLDLEAIIGFESDDRVAEIKASNKRFILILSAAILLAFILAGTAVTIIRSKQDKAKISAAEQVKLGTKRKGLEDIKAFLARSDISVAARINKALKFLDQNRDDINADTVDFALEIIQLARKAPGQKGEALLRRANFATAEMYDSIGKHDEAIPYLEEVSKISPAQLKEPGITMGDYWTAKGLLAVSYLAAGRKAEAQKLSREIASTPWQSGDVEALTVAIKTHDDATALKLIDDSSGKHPIRLGKICRILGRSDLSELCMKREKMILLTSEDNIEYSLELTRMFLSQNKIDEARKCMQHLYQTEDLCGFTWRKRKRPVIEIVSLLVRLGLIDEASKIAFSGTLDKPKLKLLKAHILARKGDLAGARALVADESNLTVIDPYTKKKVHVLDRIAEMEAQGKKGQELIQMDELPF